VLDVPAACDPKVRLVELRTAAGLATPVPLKATLCGLEGALSVTASEAEIAPEATGAKVSEMVQLAPALTLDPQVVVSPKYSALVPVIAMLLMLSAVLPVFESLIACAALVLLRAWLPKAMLVVLNDTRGPVPVPVKATDCEPFGALSVMVSDAPLLPGTVGTKLTDTVQLPPAFSVAPQVWLWLNWPGFVPPRAILLMLSAAMPVL
jgi:hypothetical protein